MASWPDPININVVKYHTPLKVLNVFWNLNASQLSLLLSSDEVTDMHETSKSHINMDSLILRFEDKVLIEPQD